MTVAKIAKKQSPDRFLQQHEAGFAAATFAAKVVTRYKFHVASVAMAVKETI